MRTALLVAVSVTGLLMGLVVGFGPWVASVVFDEPLGTVDGLFDPFLIGLGLCFAGPSIVLLAARRRFASSGVRLAIALAIGTAITLIELSAVAVLLTDDSGDGQTALVMLVPIPFALLATVLLAITALVGRRGRTVVGGTQP